MNVRNVINSKRILVSQYLNKLGFSFNLQYLSPLVKVLSLENEKKNLFSFCIFLAYSYLCTPN